MAEKLNFYPINLFKIFTNKHTVTNKHTAMSEFQTNTEQNIQTTNLSNDKLNYDIDFTLKVKLIFFLLVKSHIYSCFGRKIDSNFLNSLDDINESNDKLISYITKKMKPLISPTTSDEDKDNIIKKTNEEVSFLTDYLFGSLTEKSNEDNLIDMLKYYFLVNDQDLSHPFIPQESVQKLSSNVKFVVSKILLSDTQLLHDSKSQKKREELYEIINDNIKTLDNLLEYAIFQARYSQFSSIGYMCNMTYSDNDPYDVFNKEPEIDKLLRTYLD